MRVVVGLLTTMLLAGSLLACSSGYGVQQNHVSVMPVELRSSDILAKVRADTGRRSPDTATLGIYAVASQSVVNGYPFNDRANAPPVCSVGGFNSIENTGIAVDRKGDLLVTDEGTNTITIFKGPGLCGPKLGTITDPTVKWFQDVASRDGQTIVAGFNKQPHVSVVPGVAVCTLSGGCTHHLSLGLGVGLILGVAVAPNGDCWATAQAKQGKFLVYFAHCSHDGVVATGLAADDPPGSLDIDAKGDLVVTADAAAADLRIYSGCNPACTPVGGPFPLRGNAALHGHLDGSANKFIVSERGLGSGMGQLDVYSYSPTAVTYLYSITNGLTLPDGAAAAFCPNSKE
ncbi:MAG: hypothetical protein JO324_04805 [Candidatus Eremiobacteraeota bacterium]|nr:hypothetical protein [Candidatus Eremiobacteraeota bacterium]